MPYPREIPMSRGEIFLYAMILMAGLMSYKLIIEPAMKNFSSSTYESRW